MPVTIVVKWRRPDFNESEYTRRRHELAEFLTQLGYTAGVDFPEYVPPEEERARRQAAAREAGEGEDAAAEEEYEAAEEGNIEPAEPARKWRRI